MLQSLTTHLWQSTFFALAVGLLTMAFRKNRAQVRYWLWLSASLKFFIPFALLLNLGRYLETWMPAAPQAVSYTIEQFSEPFFPDNLPVPVPAPETTHWMPIAIVSIWLCGFATVALIRFRNYLRVRAAVRASTPCGHRLQPVRSGEARSALSNIEIRVSPGLLEPGVVGLLRPILLLPEGIGERLTPSELNAVLAHELCHIRRRDNLFAALHMAVEAIFWFHPLVWWIGARLVDERERACDEEVLSQGNPPEVYADAILNVCKLYVESPLACVSGVSGASIRRRIETIMSNRKLQGLNRAKKLLLATAGIAALIGPIAIGLLIGMGNIPTIHAQSPAPPPALTPRAIASQPPPARPKFEVASIRPCNPQDKPAGGGNGGGRAGGGVGSAASADPELFRSVCRPMALLIQMAYVQFANGHALPQSSQWAPRDIQGVPDWSESYTIEAKPASPQTRAMMNGPMLQTLLEDRFKLKIHHESKEIPVYALVVAKGGAKLQPTPQGGCTLGDPDGLPPPVVPGQPLPCGYMGGSEKGGVEAVGVPISSLFPILREELRRYVIDQTGLTGLFNYHFDVGLGAPNSSPQLDDPAYQNTVDTITNALEKLGLKIQPAKGTEDILVVDHIERPSEN